MNIEICRVSRHKLITSRKRHTRHCRQERMKNENPQDKRDINDFFNAYRLERLVDFLTNWSNQKRIWSLGNRIIHG